MTAQELRGGVVRGVERIGRLSVAAVEGLGHYGWLIGESLFWIVVGPRYRQTVRIDSVFAHMMEIGIRAIPIITMMAGTIGVMLAIQGIHTLRLFGAESRVVIGIALSVTREFAPLITGILVAGRTGAALAARLGTMRINQEIDALHVMAINPVRFLVAPALIAMLVMVPILTFYSDLVGLYAAGLYVNLDLGMSMAAYFDQTVEILTIDHIMHGISKSAIFAVLITIVGVANGFAVTGGAEGVGKATTRAVVQSISAIVVTDMIFVFAVTR